MARCDEYEEILWIAAATGDPPFALQRHLTECASCRQALYELSAVQWGLTALRDVATPAFHFAAPVPRAWSRPRFAYLCSMVLLFLVGSALLLSRQITHRHSNTMMMQTQFQHVRMSAPPMLRERATPHTLQPFPSLKTAPMRLRQLQIAIKPKLLPSVRRKSHPMIVTIYGSPSVFTQDEIAHAIPFPRDRIIPLSSQPLTHVIVCLGNNPLSLAGTVIPIYHSALHELDTHIEEYENVLPVSTQGTGADGAYMLLPGVACRSEQPGRDATDSSAYSSAVTVPHNYRSART